MLTTLQTMAELHIQAKLVNLLNQDNIQLRNPPYTTEDSEAGQQSLQELAVNYAPIVCISVSEVASALESLRSQAVKSGMGNKTYRETCVELFLPKDLKKYTKKNYYLETKLDVLAQDIMDRITEQYGLKYIQLIFKGKTLTPEKRLDEQNVKNKSKMMVLRVSVPERKKQMLAVEEEKKTQDQSVQRTQKGFQILSERDGTNDPATTPFLEIADQKGNPLKIPHSEKKALILAMGFHEKGRALMKRKQYEAALGHLVQADDQFVKCDSKLLNTVDNYAVLQLDIVWCYRALEALSYLDDGKRRLQMAEDCFHNCYGDQQQRLMKIKGNARGEEVLFLRLYLLQSILAHMVGKERQATQKLKQAEDLYGRLCLDPGDIKELKDLGFSEQEARLGLRACHGNVAEAALHITHRRQEREEMKQKEREKRRMCVEGLATLRELGYSKKDAAWALLQTDGDMDGAYRMLLDSAVRTNNTELPINQSKVEQLTYPGFEPEVALRLTGENIQVANQVVLPPELLSPFPASSLSEEPSTTSESACRTRMHALFPGSGSQGEAPMDVDLVNEVLKDIPLHEEDYLDLTLEEESEVIDKMKSYLYKNSASSS
ncbi:NEDD8 ultimate buster 1 isoform X1 [Salmo salar]|uniref:NEDD8 ultimate buster 1 isoform X1 n=2 Tax=Salmo salar TaxID=8030 RepID=A0A1S3QA14_SALSA|nr:NEDD8 ultimate buster 1 isoform X1 [Salmo salar]XP_045566769.1 NEDD8 ultimate buster 1 isoform X1 [Salmo salar]|eukprot:XP_014036821.1 PREDICTED: NEDD8 ultimate buster 1-like isoform X1 [Salmo salar]